MRAALTCSAMKLVRTTRKNTGTEICQPLPLDFSIHSMITAEIGPASNQYQVAPTSRKSGAASVSVPAVTSTIIPCCTSGRTTWALPAAQDVGVGVAEVFHGPGPALHLFWRSPGEVVVRVAAVQQEHSPGDQHRSGDAGDATRDGVHRRPGHREQPDGDVDDGGDGPAGQNGSGPTVSGPHQDHESHHDRTQHR